MTKYRDDVIRLAGKVNDEATLRRVYKILDRVYTAQAGKSED